jgi:hypothetical protein
MSKDNWMRACHAAFGRPSTDKQQADYFANSVAVSAGFLGIALPAVSLTPALRFSYSVRLL